MVESSTEVTSASNDPVSMATMEHGRMTPPSSPGGDSSVPSISPVKKGLTRVKMEECLRCDECSCIYINPIDYYKHMKNFHNRKTNKTNYKARKACWSCCKSCNCKDLLSTIQKDRGNNNLFHYNIKDRWSKLSNKLQLPAKLPDLVHVKEEIPDIDLSQIKTEIPDDLPSIDISHLLSQVEVKIKMEPPEDFDMGF